MAVAPEPGGVVALGGVDVAVAVDAADRALVGQLGLDAERPRRQFVPDQALGLAVVEVAGLVALGDVEPAAVLDQPRAVLDLLARRRERNR